MLDLNFIREHSKEYRQNLKDRQRPDLVKRLDETLELDTKRRQLIQRIDNLKAEKNKFSGQISGVNNQDLIEKATHVKAKIQELEPQLREIEKVLQETAWQLPNWHHPDVPVGKDESGNRVLRKWGEPKKFDFESKDHLELGKKLDLIDVETSAKVSGARFNYLKNEAVLMQFGLVHLVFNVLTNRQLLKSLAEAVNNPFDKPFIPVVPPILMKPGVMKKMGRYDPVDERYSIKSEELILVGSAEHTLGPMHMDELIPEKNLPIRYIGYSTSFRREAGSYGKDMQGILRVHQFDKLEMESFIQTQYSLVEQDFFVAIQEYLMQQLQIPYQVVAICTGDMGDPDYRQIDLEAWIPSQGKYRETHTADLMTDYQARRLNIRFVGKERKKDFVHMNDATVFAIGRTLIAILENYQQKDGQVAVPEVLREYVGKEII